MMTWEPQSKWIYTWLYSQLGFYMLHETLEFILKNSEEKYIFENILILKFSKTKEKNVFEKFLKTFLKRKRKESYLIWVTRWTVSCPNSNNHRQRRQKLGMQNCYSGCKICCSFSPWQWRQQTGAQYHGPNITSQLRTTNQQVH